MKKMYNRLMSMVNATNLLALAAVIYTVNAACAWAHHQPELPEEAKRFRKF